MADPPTSKRSAWLLIAIASGACAAFNGVFAKLTTTELTSSWALGISHALGFHDASRVVELGVRGSFFALNLTFNAVMWALFTRALTLASSTVRVSVINTSANFVVTAVLGALVFAEALPPLWWAGAALLVAGSVVIGMREEKEGGAEGAKDVVGAMGTGGGEATRFLDEAEEDEEGSGESRRGSVELRDVHDGGGDSDSDGEGGSEG